MRRLRQESDALEQLVALLLERRGLHVPIRRADDVVFLPLYRRVFPHWAFDPRVRLLASKPSLRGMSATNDAELSNLFS